MVKVYIIESEAGWGQKIEEEMDFPTQLEAEQFCKDYNTKYNPPMDEAPDWYMFAKVENQERGSAMLR